MNKAVVVDLDGTLIDSLGDIAAALNRLLDQEGRKSLALDQVETLVGEGVNVLIQGAWTLTGAALTAPGVKPMVERYLDLYFEEPSKRTIVFDGVPAMLQALKARGLKVGVCTNKPDKITLKVLQNLGLSDLIDGVVGGDFPRRKPDGEHLLETLRCLNADPKASLYVGDSGTDVAAARAAQVPIVCVGFGYSHGPVTGLGADWIINDFNDPEQLYRIGREAKVF